MNKPEGKKTLFAATYFLLITLKMENLLKRLAARWQLIYQIFFQPFML
jgi:hypothetical protein